MVGAVDDGDVDVGVGQCTRGLESAETAADDDDARAGGNGRRGVCRTHGHELSGVGSSIVGDNPGFVSLSGLSDKALS